MYFISDYAHFILFINLPQAKENFHFFASISVGHLVNPASAMKIISLPGCLLSFQYHLQKLKIYSLVTMQQ